MVGKNSLASKVKLTEDGRNESVRPLFRFGQWSIYIL